MTEVALMSASGAYSLHKALIEHGIKIHQVHDFLHLYYYNVRTHASSILCKTEIHLKIKRPCYSWNWWYNDIELLVSARYHFSDFLVKKSTLECETAHLSSLHSTSIIPIIPIEYKGKKSRWRYTFQIYSRVICTQQRGMEHKFQSLISLHLWQEGIVWCLTSNKTYDVHIALLFSEWGLQLLWAYWHRPSVHFTVW